MNIFAKYTLAALKKNRTRTLVTVIGIVLSVAMFTAVTEAVVSFRAYLVKNIEFSRGGYHCAVTVNDPSAIKNDGDLRRVETLGAVGYAKIGSENEYKPYLYVAAMSEGFSDLVAVHVTAGRLPQNSSEILIPAHLYANGGVQIAAGELLTLDIGARSADGAALWQKDAFTEGEVFTPRETRAYTVVGFYERPDTQTEPYSAPGYTALTLGESDGPFRCFLTLKNLRKAYDLEPALTEKYGECEFNKDLLAVSGVSRYSSINGVMFGFAAVLIVLIMFGSVSLIYNSFSISLSERVHQFGILKSIGATKRQIRGTVFYEALFLCVVGIPLGLIAGCAGLGITFLALRGSFNSIIGYYRTGGPVLSLALSPAALCVAAAVGALTTLISALIPAMRAVRIPAIEALRQTRDFKPKSVKLRTGGLTYKLFGFEGLVAAKNFKRGKRRYRAAIVSLFISVVLFISASSFCRYITDASGSVGMLYDSFDLRYDSRTADAELNDRLIKSFTAAPGVKSSMTTYSECPIRVFDSSDMTDDARKYFCGGAERLASGIVICYIDDESYAGLAGAPFDPGDPAAVLVNRCAAFDRSGGGMITDVDFFNAAAGDSVTVYEPLENDYDLSPTEDGKLYKWNEDGSGEEFIPEKDAKTVKIKIAAVTDGNPYYVSGSPAFILPVSAMSHERSYYLTQLFILSDDHRATAEAMRKTLSEAGLDGSAVYDAADEGEAVRSLVTIVNVFAYGFIILISLIALTNVFNSVSTNILLRRRELAMYRSIGMTRGGFYRMMNYECIICGARGLMWGLPVSILVTLLIYNVVSEGFSSHFYIPWYSIATAVFSVFFVVFVSMLYTMRRIRKENTIDVLRNENI